MRLSRQNGSIAVECALALPLMVAIMIVVMQFGFLCIQRQLMTYTAFMAARSAMVGGDPTAVAQKILPWVQVFSTQVQWGNEMVDGLIVSGHQPLFNVGPLGKKWNGVAYEMTAEVPVYSHKPACFPNDDNRLPGGDPC